MVEIIDEASFEEKVLGAQGPVLVDFFSLHCMPCKKMEPVLEEVAEDYAGRMAVYKMEVGACYMLAHALGVESFPTFIVFEDGQRRATAIGPKPKEVLLDYLGLA